MPRSVKTALMTLTALLAMATSAGAWEIARPLEDRIPYSANPKGDRVGSVRAITRGQHTNGLLVIKRRSAGGRQWLGVRIGKRPNNRVGWIRKDQVRTFDARYLINVSLAAKTVTLFKEGKRIWKARVVIGKAATPTPRGLFALHDYYRVRDDLRPWVIELTAHSEVHKTFQGGPGRVALHGRHGSLRAPWGTRASNGCVRTPNWALHSIRRQAPIGTPVRVR